MERGAGQPLGDAVGDELALLAGIPTTPTGSLASKTDARNQTASYSYDTNKRMTAKLGATLYYDTNPFGTSEYTAGRLAAAVYAGRGRQIRESYGYTRGGRLKWSS